MEYRKVVCNPLQENCYIIWDESKECAIIDCGALQLHERQEITQIIESKGLTPKYALQTHMHFDHIYGLCWLKEQYGLAPRCHESDLQLYSFMPQASEELVGIKMEGAIPPVENTVRDNETIALGDTIIQVIHTPGHTPGGVCYYAEKDGVLFTGDTLFMGSVGRTDLPQGNMLDEINSIRERLFILPDNTSIMPGHGPSSSIGWEKSHNMYL